KRFPEYRTEEHVCVSCTDHPRVGSQLLHDFHSVTEREGDSFLGRTEYMRPLMVIEIQPIDHRPGIPVFQHAFRPVPEGKNGQPFSACGNLGSQQVHLLVAQILCEVFPYPGIEDTGSVDTKEDSQPFMLGGMVYMREWVHPGSLIVHVP